MVSGGGTNLQAILDSIDNGTIRNARVEAVISNNRSAYALERARNHGIEAVCISPRDYESREQFNEALLEKVNEYQLDLIVLAGFLVAIPAAMIQRYRNRIINIHPSLLLWAEGSRSGFEAGREGDGSYRAFCRRGDRYRADSSAEAGGGQGRRYAGDSPAPCHGGGRVDPASKGHRHDSQWGD